MYIVLCTFNPLQFPTNHFLSYHYFFFNSYSTKKEKSTNKISKITSSANLTVKELYYIPYIYKKVA